MDAQALIRIYQTGFYICIAIAIVGLLLSVLFFFRFHIGNIWLIQTGKAQRKAVQNMQEASRQNGRMRQEEAHHSEIAIQEDKPLKATEMLQSDPPRSNPPLAETEIIGGLTVTQDVVLTHTDEKII